MSWCENACQSWSAWNQNSGILAANDSPEWFTHRRCFNKCWANKPWKMAHRNRWFMNIYDGLPMKKGDFPWQTVSHNQMVTHNPLPTMAPALFSDIGKGLHHSIAVGTRQQYHPAISETPVLEAWCHFCSKLNQCVASCGTNHGNLIALPHLLRFFRHGWKGSTRSLRMWRSSVQFSFRRLLPDSLMIFRRGMRCWAVYFPRGLWLCRGLQVGYSVSSSKSTGSLFDGHSFPGKSW